MLQPVVMAESTPSVARALVNPVGLGVAAGAATVAVALTNPLVAAVGGGAYVLSVLVDAIRRSRKKAKARAQLVSGMPDPDELRDPNAKAAANKILAAKAKIQKVIDETPPDVMLHMEKTVASLDEMQSYSTRLLQRAEEITRYLSSVNLPALVQEVKQLATRAAAAKDPEARQSFDDAKNARMDEIRTLKELRAQKERIDANLMRVVAVLGSLPTKIVQLRTLDAVAMDQLSGDITHDIDAIGEELKTSERVIKELVPQ
jgi:hypothetical protein